MASNTIQKKESKYKRVLFRADYVSSSLVKSDLKIYVYEEDDHRWLVCLNQKEAVYKHITETVKPKRIFEDVIKEYLKE